MHKVNDNDEESDKVLKLIKLRNFVTKNKFKVDDEEKNCKKEDFEENYDEDRKFEKKSTIKSDKNITKTKQLLKEAPRKGLKNTTKSKVLKKVG